MEVRKRRTRSGREERVSIHTIAKLAGVSSATVSRVLNGSDLVKPETRERVLQVAQEAGYRHPSRLARGLRTNRTGLVGLIVTDILNPYYALLAREVEDAAKEANMIMLVSNDDWDTQASIEHLRAFGSMHVDGILVSNWIGSDGKREELRRLRSEGVVVVAVGDLPDEDEFDVIAADTFHGAQQAVDHLLELGHRRIGFVGMAKYAPRARGYRARMADAGLAAPTLLLDDVVSPRRLRELLPACLPAFVREHQLTALLAHNDVYAIEAVRTLQAYGYNLPEDVAVIGFDNTPYAELANPTLTSVALPCRDMARAGLELIRQRLDKSLPTEPVRKLLPTELIVRDSTGPPGDIT